MTGKMITYILLFVIAVGLLFASRLVRKMENLKFSSLTNNKLLFRIFMVAGYGLLLCIPNKSIAWGVLLFMFFLLMRVMQSLRDGLDEDGVYLAGRRHDYSRFETYSMRRLEKVTEFRFYRKSQVRMMEFPNQRAEQVERLIASKGLKKQQFEEIVVRRKQEQKQR